MQSPEKRSAMRMKMRTLEIFGLIVTCFLANFHLCTANICEYKNPEESETPVGDQVFFAHFNPRTGCINHDFRWPNNTLVYKISKDFNETEFARIHAGMAMVSKETCIKFRERTEDDVDVVEIVRYKRKDTPMPCSAGVGRKGGLQRIHLAADYCRTVGFAAHELIHGLGMFHEHLRPDRDEYITVHFDNIQHFYRIGFERLNSTVAAGYGVPYDFDSSMHYKKDDYAIDKSKPSITINEKYEAEAAKAKWTLGQKDFLSELDYERIRRMYNCPPKSP